MTLKPPRKLRIILDPGHGNLPGKTLDRDPGAVGNGTAESSENLLMALTLKWAAVEAGHDVRLTRTDEHRPEWDARTRGMGEADLYLSIHFDSVRGRSLAYYAAASRSFRGPNPISSKRFADILNRVLPDPEFVTLPDYSSNHTGGLYIRDALAPVAVLWEIDPVHRTSAPERIARAADFIRALELAVQQGVL